MTGGRERLVVLLGYPLGHSLSPAIHNASFEAQGLPFRYRSHPVEPERLGHALQELKESNFAGANVTVPHKRSIVEFLDESSEVVRAVGAANTLVWRTDGHSGTLFGHNTDVGGFLATLRMEDIDPLPSIILGAGGAARAVAYGLLTSSETPKISVAARSLERARKLVEGLAALDPSGRLEAVSISAAGPAVRYSGLVVNATPVGMYPHVGDTPWPSPSDFHPGQIVYDLIYNPGETRLMHEAGDAGAEIMGGAEMLIQQAALSYRLWTGADMNLEAARAAMNS